MLPGKTREELENNLIYPISLIKRKRPQTNRIKQVLLENNKIIGGNIQSVLNNPKKELPKLDWRVLLLITEQIYLETGIDDINYKKYYTEAEIQKARQYSGKVFVEGDISLPLTLENVIELDYDKYLAVIDVKLLAQMSSLLLNYNFDIQRESRKKIVRGETIREATLIMENVEEIKEHLLKDTLEVTQLVINAGAGTSYKENELIYDSEKGLLTINEGTVLDIVDGYHRCKASELAVNENPNIDFKFSVLILNYTDDQAMKYQGQHAKATPIAKTRQKQLSESRYADTIVKKLNNQSALANKISLSSRPNTKNKEIVSYNVLAETINKEFDLSRVIDVHLIGDYLVDFFDILIEYYEDDFGEGMAESRRNSLLAENNMFIGYIVLAKRMYEKNIEPANLIRHFDNIDFSKDNIEWIELGILDKNKNLNRMELMQRAIKNYFENITL